MSNPRLSITPMISGLIGAAAAIGSLQKSLDWPTKQPLFSFVPGTGAGQMDVWYDGVRNLASGANESLDLSGTALTDPFGAAIAFGHIKMLVLYADPANTTDLTVGNGANPFAGPLSSGASTLVLKPGELHMFVRPTTGYVVGAGASDILKVANGAGAAANYTILVGGVSV